MSRAASHRSVPPRDLSPRTVTHRTASQRNDYRYHMVDSWWVLRVVHGSPLKIAEAITALGGEPYFPQERIARTRSRSGPRQPITYQTKPLCPGWMFANAERPFDLTRIQEAILDNMRQDGQRRPRTATVRVRLLTTNDRPKTVSEADIATLRYAEANPRDRAAQMMLKTMADTLNGLDAVRRRAIRSKGHPAFATFQDLEAVR